MIVVSDAAPLIGLAKGRVFTVLRDLFGRIFIPPTVFTEIVVEGKGRSGSQELQDALAAKWMEIHTPQALTFCTLPPHWNKEDQAVVAVAMELQARFLLADDKRLRNYAAQQSLTCLFTTDVLLMAWRVGLLSRLRPPLDHMRSQNFGIIDPVYEALLRATGEDAATANCGVGAARLGRRKVGEGEEITGGGPRSGADCAGG